MKFVLREITPMMFVIFCVCILSMGLGQQASAQIKTFEQTLVIEPAVKSEQIQILPVPDGKDWAFTARWDDNLPNALNMHQAMVDIGIKGSFYLNASGRRMDGDDARKLATHGCSIAGHTLHHYWLTTLNPNAIFREILLNRIEREDQVDMPINSFAFSFGTYWDRNEPKAQPDISDALVRSGYHHSVYSKFVKHSRYLPKNLFSTMNQVVPGDRAIKVDKFRASIKRILDDPTKYKKIDHSISLGVHPRQSAEELEKFKTLIAEYAGRDDFWYCSQTEFAAYRLSAKNTQITAVPGNISGISGTSGVYKILRPAIDCTGDDVPLSIALTGPKPSKITLDGKPLQVTKLDDQRWLVNLPYTQNQAMPKHIDWLHFDDGKSNQLLTSDEVPGLAFGFKVESFGEYVVTITNETSKPILSIGILLRKPLFYKVGLEDKHIDCLEAGQTKTLAFMPGKVRDSLRYMQGKTIVAAELFISDPNVQSRVHLTMDQYGPQPDAHAKAMMIRDHVLLTGPVDPKTFDFTLFVAMSKTDAALAPLSDDPLMQWSHAEAKVAETFAYNRVYTFSQPKQWFDAARKFTNKPAYFITAIDFEISKAGVLDIRCELPLKQVAIDGKVVTMNKSKTTEQLSSGKHRAIMTVDTRKKLVFYKVKPFFMHLSVDEKPVAYR